MRFLCGLCCCASVVLLLASPALAGSADSTIRLAGKVPPSITRPFLFENYERIWHVLAPARPLDRSRITILFYSGTKRSGSSIRLPEWSGGGAVGAGLIVIPVDRTPLPEMDFGRVTVHELTHIALERVYGRLRLPRWFHEGMAMTLSGELSFEEQVALSRAVLLHRLLPLDTIEYVNRFDRSTASLAYGESHFAAEYLIDKYGIDGIPELLGTVRKTGRFDSAFVQVFGFSTAEFNRMVLDALAARYRYVLFFSDSYLFWILVSLFVIVAFIIIRVRIARRKRLMEEEEERAAVVAGDQGSGESETVAREPGAEPPGDEQGPDGEPKPRESA